MFRAKLYFLFETHLRLAQPNPLHPPHKNRPLQWKSLVNFGPAGALLSYYLDSTHLLYLLTSITSYYRLSICILSFSIVHDTLFFTLSFCLCVFYLLLGLLNFPIVG